MRILFLLLSVFVTVALNASPIIFVGPEDNGLYMVMIANGIATEHFTSLDEALLSAEKGQGVIVAATGYPKMRTLISRDNHIVATKKKLRLFVEYPSFIPGKKLGENYTARLERGVVSSPFLGERLPEMSILGLNGVTIIPVEEKTPIISFAKVAGYDVAQFGLKDTSVWPLLFIDRNVMYSMTMLSDFYSSRFGPSDSWRTVFGRILKWVARDEEISIEKFPVDPKPSYSEDEPLPENARYDAVRRGADWLWNGRFLIHPTWAKEYIRQYQTNPNPNHFFGPPVSDVMMIGDGSFGVMEGHASEIYHGGNQKYRYFIRADVQGEASMLLASASMITGDVKYSEVAEKLLDYLFYTSEFRGQTRGDVSSPSYGLLGWANTHQGAFFNDDNARCILGAIGASSIMGNQRWNKFIVENILANYRTSSRQGFQGGSLNEADIIAKGWQWYADRDYINPHPHFESWMWACYLWLYDKCGYRPLLEKAKSGIRIMMENYPDKWHVQNGMQQERARMVLPLAWLVRIEDTPEHRLWLDTIVSALLDCQVACGAIREELGRGNQDKNKILVTSNEAYGKNEAPLIAVNGDEVSDMLYTCNFLFFALNEAAHATGKPEYEAALRSLADFLVRIQVRSERHKDLEGAWFRAFDYGRWDYWASNADDGWGAWSTLTGWIQSWIVSTEALVYKNVSYWEQTKNMDMTQAFDESRWMLERK